jgi:hypothetical protein
MHPRGACASGICVPEHPVTPGNLVTGGWDLRIERADERVLIATEFVEEAFNEPTEQYYGKLALFPLELFVIFDGRNRQVKYRLVELHGEGAWVAWRVSDSHAP